MDTLTKNPPYGMHRIVGEKVGNSLGEVEYVEVEEEDVGWGKKLRVRVK